MKQIPTIDVLRAAKKRISNPKRWCKDHSALDRFGNGAGADSTDAVRWCASGAIHKELMEHGGSVSYYGYDALIHSMNLLAIRRFGRSLETVNDFIGRKEAIKVFDDAIAELKKVPRK